MAKRKKKEKIPTSGFAPRLETTERLWQYPVYPLPIYFMPATDLPPTLAFHLYNAPRIPFLGSYRA